MKCLKNQNISYNHELPQKPRNNLNKQNTKSLYTKYV